MPYLSKKRVQTRQPQEGNIAVSDKFRSRIQRVIYPSCDRTGIVQVGTVGKGVTAAGIVSTHSSSGINLLRAQFNNPYTASNGWVGFLGQFVTTDTTNNVLLSLGSNSGSTGNSLFIIATTGSGTLQHLLGGTNSNTAWVDTGKVIADNRPHTILLLSDGYQYKLFLDGKKIAEASTGLSAPGYMNYTWVCAGGHRRTIDGSGGDVSVALIASVVNYVADDEAAELTRNPWSLFKKQDKKIWIPSAGGGSSTNLIIQDSTHSLTSDNLDLSTSLLLTIQDSTHSLSSDSLFLSTDWLLTVQDSTHSLTSDNITLDITNSTNLIIQEATHSVTSDNLLITTEWLLDIASAAHALTSDNLDLSTALSIIIQKSIHSLTSDNITLDTSNTTLLTIQDAVHNHIADNLDLTLDTWLVIADAVHNHLADNIDLGTELILTIQNSTHSLTSDIIILSIPSVGSCPTVEEIVAAIMIQIEAKNYLTLPQFLSFK